jgi:hypothetical protein
MTKYRRVPITIRLSVALCLVETGRHLGDWVRAAAEWACREKADSRVVLASVASAPVVVDSGAPVGSVEEGAGDGAAAAADAASSFLDRTMGGFCNSGPSSRRY